MELRDYQQEAINKMLAPNGGHLLGFKMRLGKTFTTIEALRQLQPRPKRVLLLVPPKALHVWIQHFPDAWKRLFKIYHGNTRAKPKDLNGVQQWGGDQYKQHPSSFVITTVQTYMKKFPKGLYWDVIICDEYHKYFRSHKTLSFKYFKTKTQPNIRWRRIWLLSGSPMRSGAHDLWAALHLIAPKQFNSYWKFVYKYCAVIKDTYGTQIFGIRNKEGLLKEIAPYTSFKKVNFKVERKIIYVNMTPTQKRLYTEMDADMLARLSDGSALLAEYAITEFSYLRKLLVCPKLLDPNCNDMGAGIQKILQNRKDQDEAKIIIFTPYKEALPIIRQYIGGESFIIHGGLSLNKLNDTINRFNSDDLEEAILLCTTQYAEAFSLAAADATYFLGLPTCPDELEQAEARMLSVGTTTSKTTYFITYKDTIEDALWSNLLRRTFPTQRIYE